MSGTGQDIREKLETHKKAVATLIQVFAECRSDLVGAETKTQFDFRTSVKNSSWVRDHFSTLAEILLEVGYVIDVIMEIHAVHAEFEAEKRGQSIFLVLRRVEEIPVISSLPFIPSLLEPLYKKLELAISDVDREFSLDDFLQLVEGLEAPEIVSQISLRILLSKNRINNLVSALYAVDTHIHVLCFLFLESFIAALSRLTLEELEQEFFHVGKRTIVPVFDFQGWLGSDLLFISGIEPERLISASPAELFGVPASRINHFREGHGTWARPTQWIVPDTFTFSTECASTNVPEDLLGKLALFRDLLAVAFMADYVKPISNGLQVEFRGFGRSVFDVTQPMLSSTIHRGDTIYELYCYAYEGLKADKLEIVQQFLSLLAPDFSALLKRAKEVYDAAKTTYDKYLTENVRDHFEARKHIQSRINQVIDETTTSVIGLSRDLSSDLFKIIGLVAVAFIGALLKSDAVVALVGVLIATLVYICVVILFQLNTIEETRNLRRQQHKEFLASYQDMLGSRDQTGSGEAGVLKDANDKFDAKIKRIRLVYVITLVATGICLVAVLLFLAISEWQDSNSQASGTMVTRSATIAPNPSPSSTSMPTSTLMAPTDTPSVP